MRDCRLFTLLLLVAAPLALSACDRGSAEPAAGPRVIVLGFDGMDYDLTERMLEEGELPNLARLKAMGSFAPLATAVPPQSPVAWSDFITGMDAGGHGIFDFIHRDPKTMLPFLSTSKAEDSGRTFNIGKWQIPLSSGSVELLRRGQAFWEALESQGVETTIIRMPANFPPSGTAHHELSGMGTPDILGGYGTFSYYTTDPQPFSGKSLSGGKLHSVFVLDNIVQAKLYGPDNPFLIKKEKLSLDFSVYIDAREPVALLEVDGHEQVLKVGEWSEWIPLEFEMIPSQKLAAMGRFYIQSVRPDFRMYVTPLNFDAMKPGLPISTPADYATELAEATGEFYTQGMPEDTHALRGGVFNRDEFLSQARLAGDDVIRQYGYVLDNWKGGFLFYYFGNADQISHMLWRPMDPGHPAYDPVNDPPFADAVRSIYRQLDGVVGTTLDRMKTMGGDTMLLVMSDHGFTSWRRSFNLNTWLKEQGYLVQVDPSRPDPLGILGTNVDWTRTRAYGLGINSLYINVAGREKRGVVPESERRQLIDEIRGKLLATLDPSTGEPAITKVYVRDEWYSDDGYREVGPDLVVGYAKGTRGSDAGALGGIPANVIEDNTSQWSGDHCMDHESVPGVLFTSRPLGKPARSLGELAPAILSEYGIEGFPAAGGAE
jgi:predicted AlkP superfamily phosphohydrolase/phosphomutase